MEEVIPGSCGCSILEIVKENGNDEAIFGNSKNTGSYFHSDTVCTSSANYYSCPRRKCPKSYLHSSSLIKEAFNLDSTFRYPFHSINIITLKAKAVSFLFLDYGKESEWLAEDTHGLRKAENSRHLTDDARSRSSAEVSDRSDINSGLMGACFCPSPKA
ncbi:hypothetical protein CDAR_41101 [Caerostris darwini]|uniref:Uncharacterized protein n=1 Tax=Caerostris darwini TaxID=1538125 RepID=A0AAV4W557_9ARAC|nr:hypothetical protein CDAR_41101 [Caerostris darwini]